MTARAVLIAGATGLLGSTLVPVLQGAGYHVVTQARSSHADYSADLSSKKEAFAMLNVVRPNTIINLVGLTSVENCEASPNEAYLANTKVVENIAAWIKDTNVNSHLIQISTDHVYNGTRLNTEDKVVLTNLYAFSKYAGELAAAQVSSTILRTNFIGRSKTANRDGLTDWVYKSLTSGIDIQVLSDVFFSPLSMTTLAEMIQIVIERKVAGVFNLGSHEGMSKANLSFAFAKCLGLPTNHMSLIEASQAKFLKAYRPKNMRMDCSKFENAFDVRLPNLSDEIERVAKDYREIA